MLGKDDRWPYTALCGMRAKWPSERRTRLLLLKQSWKLNGDGTLFISAAPEEKIKLKNTIPRIIFYEDWIRFFGIIINLLINYISSFIKILERPWVLKWEICIWIIKCKDFYCISEGSTPRETTKFLLPNWYIKSCHIDHVI